MKWIGLTGGIATGKSTVASLLRSMNYPVVDADELARQVVIPGSSGLKSVVDQFGAEVLQPDGTLDRKKLGDKVFGNKNLILKLEGILHPLIRDLAAKRKNELETGGHHLAFYDVPLLFEKKMQSLFDKTVVVACSPEIQESRLRARNNLSDKEINARLSSQLSIDEKVKGADFVIWNNGSVADLELEVDRVLKQL